MSALTPFLWLVSNKTGRIISAAILLMLIAVASYLVWERQVRNDAIKDIVIESQTQVIQHMQGTADKLNKVNNAKSNFRRTLRTQPDSLREDDGFRRND